MPEKNIEVLTSESVIRLRDTLKSIRTPFAVTSQYYDGKNHIAWLSTDRKFTDSYRKLLERKLNSKE